MVLLLLGFGFAEAEELLLLGTVDGIFEQGELKKRANNTIETYCTNLKLSFTLKNHFSRVNT